MLRQILDILRCGRPSATAGLLAGSLVVGTALGAATAKVSEETATDASVTADRPRVEVLLDRLADSPSQRSAGRLERMIMADWTHSGSDTVDLLMDWAAEAMKTKDHQRALQYLDRVVRLAPDFAEGWNRRATVYYLLDDYGSSLSDIGHALSLQPRHFGALNGLGLVLDDIDRDDAALDAFRRAIKVHPYLEGVDKRIERLTKEVEGQPI